MNERIRISDADREHVAARLREHFAEGRLTQDELDERITAAFSAKTLGDLRPILADLPDSAPVTPQAARPPWAGRRGPVVVHRGPRLFPLAMFALVAALVIPGAGWLFLAFFKLVLLFWLAACLIGIVAAARLRRRVRHTWRSGEAGRWQQYQWHG
ncbi:MAG TPA: DUF1707 domain-containing protein [Streptosporangiaceae bacterium]|nr:DUF1707 domain-containing protein [Streptosporangiaceae bacterium]